MSASTVVNLVSAAPPVAEVAGGVLVFPVSPILAWLVIGGLLAIACAVLGLVSERKPTRSVYRGRRGPAGWGSPQPHPQRS